jgi:hypothetical protein
MRAEIDLCALSSNRKSVRVIEKTFVENQYQGLGYHCYAWPSEGTLEDAVNYMPSHE